MARIDDGGDLIECSFCGKSQKRVMKLIAGPGVYICDECIDLCNEIIEEELNEPAELAGSAELEWDRVPQPAEIYEFLDRYVTGQEAAKRALSVAVHGELERWGPGALRRLGQAGSGRQRAAPPRRPSQDDGGPDVPRDA